MSSSFTVLVVLVAATSSVLAQSGGSLLTSPTSEGECRKQSYERHAEGSLNRAARAAYIAQCVQGESPPPPQSRATSPQSLNLAGIRQLGAQQIALEELKLLLESADMRVPSNQGRMHSWTNNPDGTLVATYMGSGSRPTTAAGRWRVADNASFCVEIDWNDPTRWCRFMFRSGDRYFGVGSTSDDTAAVYEFSLRK